MNKDILFNGNGNKILIPLTQYNMMNELFIPIDTSDFVKCVDNMMNELFIPIDTFDFAKCVDGIINSFHRHCVIGLIISFFYWDFILIPSTGLL